MQVHFSMRLLLRQPVCRTRAGKHQPNHGNTHGMEKQRNDPLCCGLDFGTSNSAMATVVNGTAQLVPLEGGNNTVPSAVFFGSERDARFLIGRAATAAYVDGLPGRLMRSLKSVLGSSLVDEKTQVYRRRIAFCEVIEMYVATLKARAEQFLQTEIDSVVHGRPVHFVDNDTQADRHGENALRRIAQNAGFKHVSFQFEPIAAARDFERQVDREHIALIADIGGGTSDFTVVRLSPSLIGQSDRASDILATGGIRLGGTDYDHALSMASFMPLLGYRSLMARGDIDVPAGAYWELSTWSSLHLLYDGKRLADLRQVKHSAAQPQLLDRLIRVIEQRRGHSILIAAESAKIDLSHSDATLCDLDWIEPALSVDATRPEFENATQRLSDRLASASAECVRSAGLRNDQITTVFFTGGTSSIPSVRRAVLGGFRDALVVDGDKFGSVGLGLSIEAASRYA